MSLNDNREWVQLLRVIDRMEGKRIPVIGDAIQDHYVFGRVERICPEAPVPVFIPERDEIRPGGAANVARQLRALHCEPIEVFGPTRSVKTRYMAGSHLMLRVDQDRRDNFTLADQHSVKQMIQTEKPDVVVISDYGKGWVNRLTVECALSVPWSIVDPKGTDWSKYDGCELLCPNVRELKEADLAFPRDCPDRMVIKRGAQGLRYCLEGNSLDFPATAKHVYDVTGAGDTVVAVLAAAIAAGAGMPKACQLANLAAGYVVGEVGTAVCPLDTLKKLVEESYQ